MGKVGSVSLYGGESESSDNLKTFGAMLKVLRDEAGLTQETGLASRSRHWAVIEQEDL